MIRNEEESIVAEWMGLLSEVGFPIVISFYLLHRIEQKLEAICKALKELA